MRLTSRRDTWSVPDTPIGQEDEDAIEDYDIPKLISLGYGKECNCVLESRDGDYYIRVTCVIEDRRRRDSF